MKFTKRATAEHAGSDKFLKFKDGESKNLILRGEIYEFHMKWVNGKSQVTTANDPEAKSRFKVNAVTYESGVFGAKIWEFPLTVYNQLAEVNAEYALEKTKLKITRQGVGTDTVYHILPLLSEKDQITLNIQALLERVQLNILDAKPKASIPGNGWDGNMPEPRHEDIEDLPFYRLLNEKYLVL